MDADNDIALFTKSIISHSEFNQKEIAEKIGIKPGSLSMMLNGKAPFPIRRLEQIIKLFPAIQTRRLRKFIIYKKFNFDLSDSISDDDINKYLSNKDCYNMDIISICNEIKRNNKHILGMEEDLNIESNKTRRDQLERMILFIKSENAVLGENLKKLTEEEEIKLIHEPINMVTDSSATYGKSPKNCPQPKACQAILPTEEDFKNPQSEVKMVAQDFEYPVISFANAKSYDQAVEPLDAFAKDCADHFEKFAIEKKSGYFALLVEGDSMSPTIPHGSTVCVAGGEFPQRGDIVVAKIRETEEVVIKKYYRKDNNIKLESINPEGQNYSWHSKEDRGYVEWMWPVLEVKINLRQQRWERTKNGKS